MVNLKWGLVPAIFALFVSVLLGAVSGGTISHIILRALAFAAVFFGLGIGIWFVVKSYFPELLAEDNDTELQDASEKTGSRVNITIDSAGEFAVPELYKTSGRPDELGNIDDLISGVFKVRSESVDRKQEERYNEERVESVPDNENIDFQDMFQDTAGFDKSLEDKPVFTPSFVDDAGGLGGLPDLDEMAMAFSPGGGSLPIVQSGGSKGSSLGFGGVSPVSNDLEEKGSSSNYVGNKPQPMKGDFDPQEIAQGIRTMLSKDK
ncbi:MAG: hypothetical protein FWF68_08230 [Spirochaetes bacterium]|nr:hypothetical protein [Spirochaetota bacterium]